MEGRYSLCKHVIVRHRYHKHTIVCCERRSSFFGSSLVVFLTLLARSHGCRCHCSWPKCWPNIGVPTLLLSHTVIVQFTIGVIRSMFFAFQSHCCVLVGTSQRGFTSLAAQAHTNYIQWRLFSSPSLWHTPACHTLSRT